MVLTLEAETFESRRTFLATNLELFLGHFQLNSSTKEKLNSTETVLSRNETSKLL